MALEGTFFTFHNSFQTGLGVLDLTVDLECKKYMREQEKTETVTRLTQK